MGLLAGECAQEMEGLARTSGVELHRELPEGLPDANADRGLARRIIANLLSNAIKHTPAGGHVTIGASGHAEMLLVWVRDTGEGIPEEFHPLIFEKFAQVALKKQGLATDRGLGLAFCKMAVEAHGGRISVASRPGEGSTFSVLLPAASEEGP
jgi:signal transduction histidine kinase